MDSISMLGKDFEPLLKLLGAFILAMPIAWHREKHSRIVGLRTFPLVSVGCCAYILIGTTAFGADDAGANARIMQGLMSGIGFVGGGAILKHDDHVAGTASAASIWVTGALGASVAYGYWYYAIALAATNFFIVAFLSGLKTKPDADEIDD